MSRPRLTDHGQAVILRGDARALPLPDASVDLICTSPPYFALRSYTDGGALACVDRLGLIARAVVIWDKPNGLPESVRDRVRRSHEDWVHLVKQPRYFSAVDTIRQPHVYVADIGRARKGYANGAAPYSFGNTSGGNPLGALPGSVWTIPTEPLQVPAELGVDHFAAYPTEWPRRIIMGWSPSGICTACGEGRRPVATRHDLNPDRPQARAALAKAKAAGLTDAHLAAVRAHGATDVGRAAATQSGTGRNTAEVQRLAAEAKTALGGYFREFLLARPSEFSEACACPDTTAPTRPAVVLDPFGGTGTTALVAKALGRVGISVDRSADYCRLATWRTNDPGQLAKVRGERKPVPQAEGQIGLDLFDLGEVVA